MNAFCSLQEEQKLSGEAPAVLGSKLRRHLSEMRGAELGCAGIGIRLK